MESTVVNSAAKSHKIYNRKERRLYMKNVGILSAKNNKKFSDRMRIVENNIENGKKLEEYNNDIYEKSISNQLEKKESSIRSSLKERGLSKSEVDSRIALWNDSLK